MRQGRRGMAQRHVGYCEVTAWNGLRRRERGQGDLGDVRTSAGAEPGLATIGGWRLFVRRACIPLSGALLIVIGVLMLTGSFTVLTAILARWTPEFLLEWL